MINHDMYIEAHGEKRNYTGSLSIVSGYQRVFSTRRLQWPFVHWKYGFYETFFFDTIFQFLFSPSGGVIGDCR